MSNVLKVGEIILVAREKFVGECVKLGRRGKKLDADIHVLAVSAMHHVSIHGDKGLVSALVRALPKSSRKQAMIAWFNGHCEGAMKVDDDGEITLAKGRTAEQFRVTEAANKPFWDFTAEVAFKLPGDLSMKATASIAAKRDCIGADMPTKDELFDLFMQEVTAVRASAKFAEWEATLAAKGEANELPLGTVIRGREAA